ncbi:MAG: hypothetical protein ACYDH9_15345 [Limisphaerales bacterium]
MQRKQHRLIPLIKVITCGILALGAFTQAQAGPDPSGSWTWTTPGRNGGPDRKSTLKLKVDGEKVTGTLSAPGRGGQGSDTEISDGKLKGDEVSFTVNREFNGNKITFKYNGKIDGDTIKGKIEIQREGQDARSRDWEAKRGGEKKDDKTK